MIRRGAHGGTTQPQKGYDIILSSVVLLLFLYWAIWGSGPAHTQSEAAIIKCLVSWIPLNVHFCILK